MITIKKPEDIAILREGGRRHGEMLRKLCGAVRPGVSTESINDLALSLIAEAGDAASFLNYTPRGVKRPYPAAVCVSLNDAIVHGIPNEHPRVFKEGDIVTVDLGLTHDGLVTDAAITVGVGSISKEAQRLINATAEALQAGIDAAKGGNRIGDIGYAVQQVARRHKLSLAEDLAGHGVGYSVHEDPFVPNTGRQGDGPELVPGMVLAVEPMLTLGGGRVEFDEDEYTVWTADGSLAAHFEHTILITEGDAEILTA